MKYYKRIDINGDPERLPKDDGMYLVGIKGGEPDFWSWSNDSQLNEVFHSDYWLNTFDWYLSPVTREEIIKIIEECDETDDMLLTHDWIEKIADELIGGKIM